VIRNARINDFLKWNLLIVGLALLRKHSPGMRSWSKLLIQYGAKVRLFLSFPISHWLLQQRAAESQIHFCGATFEEAMGHLGSNDGHSAPNRVLVTPGTPTYLETAMH